ECTRLSGCGGVRGGSREYWSPPGRVCRCARAGWRRWSRGLQGGGGRFGGGACGAGTERGRGLLGPAQSARPEVGDRRVEPGDLGVGLVELVVRSEERRVGKECRARGRREHDR